MINLGNINIIEAYLGSIKIDEAYFGSDKIFTTAYVPSHPYLMFRFSDPTYAPNRTLEQRGYWIKDSSASTNDWFWIRDFYVSTGSGDILMGWPMAFSSSASTPVGVLTPTNLGSNNTCSIVGYGNLTGHSTYNLETMDRMFANCTSLVSTVTIRTPNTLQNVGGCFSGCTEMTGGALAQYNYWDTQSSISNHSGTFTDAGANSASGLQELNQIPTGWGGNLMPVSYTYTATKQNAAAWLMGVSGTDVSIPFDNLGGALNIFTTVSVSSYAGVNMRKSNIWNHCNGFSINNSPTYYYPMFWQASGTPNYPTSTSSNVPLSWIRTTSQYNGTLTGNQASGDMPGTLDYSIYGPMNREFGTFDSTRDVYFGFLVVNNPSLITDGVFDTTMDAYGIHSNTNFRTSTINWFIE